MAGARKGEFENDQKTASRRTNDRGGSGALDEALCAHFAQTGSETLGASPLPAASTTSHQGVRAAPGPGRFGETGRRGPDR